MAKRRAYGYSISLNQVGPIHDESFRTAPDSVKKEVINWIVVYGLKEKDADLAHGLDKDGVPMVPVSAATRKYRRSAMGPADPAAPPLTPAYAVSRTRLLLEGSPAKNGAAFWWEYDEHTGATWGKILDYQRKGVGKRHVKRDVIGISPAALARVRDQVLARWTLYKLHGMRTPSRARPPGPELPAPRIAVVGRTDFQNFTYGIGGDGAAESRRALARGGSTGFFQRKPGQGLTAFGGPGPAGGGPPPVKSPGPGPKPPTPIDPGKAHKLAEAKARLAKIKADADAARVAREAERAKLKALAEASEKAKAEAEAKRVKAAAEAARVQAAVERDAKVKAEKAAAAAKAKAEKAAKLAKAKADAKAAADALAAKLAADAKAKAAEKLAAEQAARATAKAKSGGFPAHPDEMVAVRSLGGSTGAVLVRDPDGGKLYVKKAGANAGHLREEAHADAAYAALGIAVPKSKIYETPAGPVKLAEFHQGVSLAELRRTDPAAAARAEAELRKHFVADALLGNWDVIGMDADNVLVTPAGTVYRIDNGGSLRYRAQGAKKAAHQFAYEVAELDSMRNPGINPSAAAVYGKVTDAEVKAQIGAILKKKDALLAALPAELRPAVKERLLYLDKLASAKPKPPGFAPRPAADFKGFALASEMESWGKRHFKAWADALSADERRALKTYTGGDYEWMNARLRTGAPFPYHVDAPYGEKLIVKAREALEKATVPEDTLAYRGIRDLTTMGYNTAADMKPGDVLKEKAFSSVSLSEAEAKNFAAPTPGHPKPNVLFRVHVPKGGAGAYLNGGDLSNLDFERELLFPPGAEFRVIGHAESTTFLGKPLPVVLLERVK